MAYTTHHGKRVSPAHAAMLRAYEREVSHSIHINQGARTLAEQTRFWLNYLRNGWPLAARPWGGAPHIKWGKQHHALDINDGLVDRVAAFYRRKGVPVSFNVPGEPWHMDTLDERKLIAAAKRLDSDPVLYRGIINREAVTKLQKLLKSLNLNVSVNGRYDLKTRRAVRRFQTKHNLPVDGVVGPRTWAAIRRAAS